MARIALRGPYIYFQGVERFGFQIKVQRVLAEEQRHAPVIRFCAQRYRPEQRGTRVSHDLVGKDVHVNKHLWRHSQRNVYGLTPYRV